MEDVFGWIQQLGSQQLIGLGTEAGLPAIRGNLRLPFTVAPLSWGYKALVWLPQTGKHGTPLLDLIEHIFPDERFHYPS